MLSGSEVPPSGGDPYTEAYRLAQQLQALQLQQQQQQLQQQQDLFMKAKQAQQNPTPPGSGQSQNAKPRSILYKTKKCRFYEKGACLWGNTCRFAHTDAERREKPDLKYTKICKPYFAGQCFDLNCGFAHSFAELRKLPDPVTSARRDPSSFVRAAPQRLPHEMVPDGGASSTTAPDGNPFTIPLPSFTDLTRLHQDPNTLTAAQQHQVVTTNINGHPYAAAQSIPLTPPSPNMQLMQDPYKMQSRLYAQLQAQAQAQAQAAAAAAAVGAPPPYDESDVVVEAGRKATNKMVPAHPPMIQMPFELTSILNFLEDTGGNMAGAAAAAAATNGLVGVGATNQLVGATNGLVGASNGLVGGPAVGVAVEEHPWQERVGGPPPPPSTPPSQRLQGVQQGLQGVQQGQRIIRVPYS
ncbi:unnamed protein product [Vitrella brassicaformis CCMP3155]|uniref:C3H1-type domain-containing protein n=1 Tax=Vitrella brassicaformis (strain CCMP3155) TaxID=1169540 RepID=A0A0G4GA55_VITBC|nr:unnamed protein product [Vitrella brassicaformis CCMP3155]|eukprot:CEM25753.1 unnamed protein product [Vitrella brassicaformis CCMP3155]